VFIGGIPKKKMIDQYTKEGADILVCTPGRLWDFISQNLINFSKIETLILDEADEML
jgi:superfamily II DNA/RNA helicase